MNKHCCAEMNKHITKGEVAIRYIPKFREYGISVLDSGSSKQDIYYCPWCGKKLPKSLRDKWFDIIEDMGLDPESPDIPEEYKSEKWWQTGNSDK